MSSERLGRSSDPPREGHLVRWLGEPYFLLRNQRTIVTVTSFELNGVCAGAGYAQRVDLPMDLHLVRLFL